MVNNIVMHVYLCHIKGYIGILYLNQSILLIWWDWQIQVLLLMTSDYD